MKRINEIVTMVLVLAGLTIGVLAGVTDSKLEVLSSSESAQWGGATHVLDIEYGDFVGYTTSTNTTTTITNALPAGTLARLVMQKLDTAWDTGSTYTDSLLVYSGWAADTDGFVQSTEIAADGTEVFANVTPIVQSEGTSVLYRATWPWQYFSTATNLLTTMKMNSHGSCISSNTQGRVKWYYQFIFPRP
jgi:hypothetical protein